VQQGFAHGAVPGGARALHQGPIEETVPAQAPEQISILRLDTDWYESTKHEFEHLYLPASSPAVSS
jgi:hypothetical protein